MYATFALSARRLAAVLCLALVASLLVAGVASAATFTVNDPSDLRLATSSGTSCVSTASTCTLRAAVQAADNAGGSSAITVPAGTYMLSIASAAANDPTTGDLDITGSASVSIRGAGAGTTVIDASGAHDRSFAVDTSTGSLTLSGVTVRNGSPSSSSTNPADGGAVYSAGTLHLTNDTFDSNQATGGNGGAISQDGTGALTVQSSTFTNNQGGGAGGAISDSSTGALTVIGDRFGLENSLGAYSGGNQVGEDGGAIADGASSSAVISDSTFAGNRTQAPALGSGGGALYLGGAGYELDRDELDGNVSGASGGAIYWANGTLTGRDDSVVGNGAGAQGGAIDAFSGQPLSLTNTTVTLNTAAEGGGIDFAMSPPIDLVNDTLYNDAAPGGSGNEIYGTAALTANTVGVQNTVIGNDGMSQYAPQPDCGDTGGATPLPVGVDMGHNLATGNTCLQPTTNNGDKPGTPLSLGAPANNGGTVLTDAEPSGAPTIDSGTNSVCPSLDARGTSRPQGSTCDIGAYEFVPPPATTPPTTNTTTVSSTTTVAGPTTTTTVTAPAATPPPGTPPAATTRGAMGVTSNGAFLGGSVDPHGINTSYSFQVGTTKAYGLNTVSGHTDSGPLTLETRISGLRPSTTYHYRLVAISAAGTTRGADRTFRTASAYDGAVRLADTKLTVHRGRVSFTLRCTSRGTCRSRVGLTVPITLPRTHTAGTLVVTRGSAPVVTVRAHRTATVSVPVSSAALTLLSRAARHRLAGTALIRPVTAQPPGSARVTLVLR